MTMKIFELNNKQTIPAVGFGVFMIPNDGPTYDATLAALKAGYRHIDKAAGYMNESDVGKAIKDSGIDRKEIFITSKLCYKIMVMKMRKKVLKLL